MRSLLLKAFRAVNTQKKNNNKNNRILLTTTLSAVTVTPPFVMFVNPDVSTESIQTGLFLTPNSFTSGHRTTHTW